jgi:hypothetical protein
MIVAYAHPHGISLNGREYLLDAPDGDILFFENDNQLLTYINDHNNDNPISSIEELEDYGIFTCDANEVYNG